MPKSADIPHPGVLIKAEVIPEGMTVTQAAKLMGVGRPALSNLLNGNAKLSAEMATRLEKAFKYPRTKLLQMQASYEATQAQSKSAPVTTKLYVPPYLGIKANQIEDWCDHNIEARIRVAVLLRTLVHSTDQSLTRADFPGNDDAERPGWDGFVETVEGNAWIPAGSSGWEFGTNKDIKTKADKDLQKSVDALPEHERKQTTFVFVTPRRWSGKKDWVKTAKSKHSWRDVRAYDASDLEQWLEQSLPGQVWFANEAKIPAQEVRSLDQCWADWANVAAPPLVGSLFNSAIKATKRKVLDYLSKPVEEPLIVAADSSEEALAFLAQLLGERGGQELAAYRDRVLVFDKPGTLPRLAQAAQNFIPVVSNRGVERELAPHAKSLHSIIIYPRNTTASKPNIVLEPVDYETVDSALKEMGKDRDQISQFTAESGRSLTVLRRRLATVAAIKTPEWSADRETATSLVPLMFVGTWQSMNESDQTGLSLLAGDRAYDEIEREVQSLAQLNDAPVWSIGTSRGVISKLDLLYAIARFVTPEDLRRYFVIAKMVLGEDDPALDLDEEQRWAAAIHGKVREFSGAFRKGISETLVLLSVHGERLFKHRLGVDTSIQASLVVHDLLPTPLTARILEANDRDLPTYAEAAPEEFLSILERDLKTDEPAAVALMQPSNGGMFGTTIKRTGLLWALEGLSWNPKTLPRAVFILARLSQVELKDNWGNKPIASLHAIFRAWMPQTAANHENRVSLVRRLFARFRDVAWDICISQFGSFYDAGHYSHKPTWRTDGYGFGEPLTDQRPVFEFQRDMANIALGLDRYTLSMLEDLIDRLHCMDEVYQGRVWGLVESWAKHEGTDAEKASLREAIRMKLLSQRAARRSKKNPRIAGFGAKAKQVYESLAPTDIMNKHAWLFRQAWIEIYSEEVEDIETIDFQKRHEHVQNMRLGAMKEILQERGIDGLLLLARSGSTSRDVGFLATRNLLSVEELSKFLRSAFIGVLADEYADPFKNLISGALAALSDDNRRDIIIKTVTAGLSAADTARFFVLAPFHKATWRMIDGCFPELQTSYWQNTLVNWISVEEDAPEAIERLLKVKRPRAAFSCIQFYPIKIDADLIYRVLSGVASGGEDKPGEYRLERHDVQQAFKVLNDSPTLKLDEKAGLEMAFIDALAVPWGERDEDSCIPNLERYVEAHPELYVQSIVWVYKRKNRGSDPPDFQVPLESVEFAAQRGHKLLESIRRMPGHDASGELKAALLGKWIADVRRSCSELDRIDIADSCIGQLLSHAPFDEDGGWPCEPVRQVMEEIQSESMMRGAVTGVYNSRGVHIRGDGGEQERELAERYRKWGQAIQFSHPYVASKLLMALSERYEHEASREDNEAGIRRRLH